ncbi:hypothetical protein NE237_008818 [Protea cynaroides]|uniref:Uncharacterized protein n=1 Tax=Protea cynaroides TaxID=273540 RepID=A0A9Q0KW94_9MAGN|nr:hypothetical protein NE237_008818 [Protea cynaroides]
MVLLAGVKGFVDHERNFESIFNGDGLSITSTFWCWRLQSLMLGLSMASSLRFHKTNVDRFLTASLLALLPLPRYSHFLRSRLRCCNRYFRFRKQSYCRKLPR